MKNLLKLIGIITLAVVIGFSFIACDNGNGPDDNGDDNNNATVGSGKFSGKDVLGNNYSLSVGSDASRAAVKGDRYKMDIRTRDGKTRSVSGTVANVNTDGTLTLQPDGSDSTFTATVGGSNLNSVAGDGDIAQIPLSDGTTLTPRSFDKIYLRANRWSSPNLVDPSTGPMRGEQYASGLSVLVKDFPTNVSRLEKGVNDRYTITVSGTSDKDLNRLEIEVQGLTENDDWVWLAGYYKDDVQIQANQPFSKTLTLTVGNSPDASYNLMDYKEVILQVTNVIQKKHDNHPDWDVINGSIPADIPNGQIMAAISNFNIALKDKKKEELAGNVGDYTFGFKADGLSVEYRQAVWHLSADNIAKVKQPGARFEFTMMNVEDILDPGTSLHFSWQDPVRDLWWQDETDISEWTDAKGWYLEDGVRWDAYRQKVSIDISKIVKDNRFAASTKLNFIIGCYWNNGEDCKNINEIDIAGVNIVVPPPSSAGNMRPWS